MFKRHTPAIIKLIKSDFIKLIPILGLAFYIAFIPHLNTPYPVHLDEWMHWAFFNQISTQVSITWLADPFSGGLPLGNQISEFGFHLFWAAFHKITSISWLAIFKYFPAIIFMITTLSVYLLTRRQGFGWEAALLTCLMTTTTGILGPGFLVPVAMGLAFIPISLYLAFHLRRWWSYLLLFVLVMCLLTIHPTTAVGLTVILIPFILLNLRCNFKHSLGVTLVLAACLLVALLGFLRIWELLVSPTVKSIFLQNYPLPYVQIPQIITTYGYLPIALVIIGTYSLWREGGTINRSLILGLLAILLLLVIFYKFHYGTEELYYRGLLYAMLLMGIVAGGGLMSIKKLKLPGKIASRLKTPNIGKLLGPILCMVIIVLTLYSTIPARQNTQYYHMIDNEDYQAFVWIRDNIDSSYIKAILDPWKATAFTAVTGKRVYTRLSAYPLADDKKALTFLEAGANDTSFLRENGISIVYTVDDVFNPDLIEVRENIYLLKLIEN